MAHITLNENEVMRGYVTALHWTGYLYVSEDSEPIDLDFVTSVDDVPTAAWDTMRASVRDFLSLVASEVSAEDLDTYGRAAARMGDVSVSFGHDFALTRNGHGAGFWDRGAGEAGETLTRWAKSMGGQELSAWGDPDGDEPLTWSVDE